MNILNVLNLSKKSVVTYKPIASKPKQERNIPKIRHAAELCRIIEGHGDRIAYEYFVSPTETAQLSYAEFGLMVRRFAAGLSERGFRAKRIALIGETSPRWIATYLGVLASGNIIVPMDKELAVQEIAG